MAFVPVTALSIALVASALCGALALPLVLAQGVRMQKRMRLQTRVASGEGTEQTFLAALLRRGIPPLRALARLLLRLRWLRAKCVLCRRALITKGYVADGADAYEAELLVCELLCGAFVSLGLLTWLLTAMPLVALVAPVLFVALMFTRAQKLLERWERRLVEQIPEALRSLGICFTAGYSLQQAFEQVAQDTPEPLGAELMLVSSDICAGKGVEDALAALELRTEAADLRFAIVSLEIQHRTGGSLQELLESAADAALASADLRRQLAVQTAQARLSARIVTVLPLVLVVILSVALEGYLQSFFDSSQGLAILLTALGMEAAGIFAVRRILGVDLG
ncbi:MAG: type II secretion system F family protein [Coriobacteriales bacterium]|jgi:tight adherence protein B|nr:type II secretion system F family protein [Coriobacteriales bacterium]